MKKKSMGLIVALTAILVAAAIAFAAEPTGNKRKGKYTYKNVYKACMQRGEVESKTPINSPGDKTMAQWERVFEKKQFDIFKCSEEWNKLSEEDLNDIYSYLWNYAADSPTPAKCK